MHSHLVALQSHLEARGWRAHIIDVPKDENVPYILISPLSDYDFDPDSSGTSDDFTGHVRLTFVAGSVSAALAFADAGRAYLSPSNRWTRLEVPGFAANVCWRSFDVADVDRDITGTALNNHRAFAKHTFHLNSRRIP